MRLPRPLFALSLILLGLAATGAASALARPAAEPEECADPGEGWIWCDDFEEDRLESYFEYASARGRFVRAEGVGFDGSFGMRARFGAGQVSAGALHLAFGRTPSEYFRPVDEGTEQYREIHWRVYVRNQPGWRGGGGVKLSRATSFVSPKWAQAMIAHVWSGESGTRNMNVLVVEPASGTGPDGRVRTTKYNDFRRLRWLGPRRGETPIFDAAHVGRWYCVEARVRLNDPGAANGIQELWIDGRLEAQRTGLDFVGRYTGYGINAVLLENYWNKGSPAEQERYFDRFVVSTKRIGC
jgi:hypothetical protein